MVQNTRDPQVVFVVAAVGSLDWLFRTREMKLKEYLHILVKLSKALERRAFFNSSLLQFTIHFFNRLQTCRNQNHISSITNQLFCYRLEKVLSYHTTRLLPILREEMEIALGVESDLEAPAAESRCCFPWAGAADLKPPKGRVSEEECWGN